jgi:malonyl-CoA O-methyltransferase
MAADVRDVLSDAAKDAAALDLRAVRRHFGRAAATYDSAAVLQREVGARMAERLDVVKLGPAAILDAGSGTGEALGELARRYPRARRVALDIAVPMLVAARGRTGERRSLIGRLAAPFAGGTPSAGPAFVCADIAALPFAPAAFDLVWSNLALQWVADLPRAFGDLHRVLRVGGLFTFTTFGPDTLKELRAAFAEVDGRPHVGRFVDMHDIGDLLVHAGFADPVMQMECLTLTYADPLAMMRDLKAIGAVNATQGRARGLMGRDRLRRALAALAGMRREGRIPATFEVVYGHAWKAPPRTTPEGDAIVRFERLGRRTAT